MICEQCLAGDMWVKAISEFGGHVWLNLPTWSTVDDLKVRPQRYSEHDNIVSVTQKLHLCVFVFCQVRWSNYTWQEYAKNTFCVIGRRRVSKAATRLSLVSCGIDGACVNLTGWSTFSIADPRRHVWGANSAQPWAGADLPAKPALKALRPQKKQILKLKKPYLIRCDRLHTVEQSLTQSWSTTWCI